MSMDLSNKTSASDDEEDLEQLRLAALQTLKKPSISNNSNNSIKTAYYKKTGFNGLCNKRGRGFHGGQGGRPLRNGQFIPRIRNTNLIPIQTVPSDSDCEVRNNETENNVPKLILPQDRYCSSSANIESKSPETTSKFNRYDNSDDSSESESEYEIEVSDPESPKPGKLERSDSLEALMQELENEIEGDSKPKPVKRKVKIKKPKKVKVDISVEQKENILVEDKPGESRTIEVSGEVQKSEENSVSAPKNGVKVQTSNEDVKTPAKVAPPQRFPRRHLRNVHKPENRPVHPDATRLPYIPQNITSIQPPAPYFVPLMPHRPPFAPHMPQYIPMVSGEQIVPYPPPQRFGRPLSPLMLSTEILSATVAAPLSPRSAAFVLQNREIVERRKRSPRNRAGRSYSRSPSPRFRRSKSPRRASVSPSRNTPSPRRYSPPRRVSPARRSPPKKPSPASKSSIHERLGSRTGKRKSRSISLSLSPSPERSKTDVKENEQSSSHDPVLEARKRKFESNEIKVKEGVIRLKPRNDEEEDVGEELQENVPEGDEEEDNLLDMNVDGLFSDEETDEENEGRFKTKSQQSQKSGVLPFVHLLKGTSASVKDVALLPDQRKKREYNDRERNRRNSRMRRSPLSQTTDRNRHESSRAKPVDSKKHGSEASERKVTHSVPKPKNRIVTKGEKAKPAPLPASGEKKIEIKIRNPAKYEPSTKKSGESDEPKEKVSRKVEVDVFEEEGLEIEPDHEPEIIIDNEDDNEDAFGANEVPGGDLRAQLSRKRAERQSKIALVQGVPTRLLQNALESAVFKKAKKRTKESAAAPKELEAVKRIKSASEPVALKYEKSWMRHRKVHVLCSNLQSFVRIAQEGKLPIHSRLGIATNVEIFSDVGKKKRKRKNRAALEQV